ncbi:DUF2608 domain-containing protein [Candidatus Dependentiae bacterium]
MRKIACKIVLALVFVSVHACAIIFESDDLNDIHKYIGKNSKKNAVKNIIVIFDIDNTVSENFADLDSWIPHKIDYLQNKGVSQNDAKSLVLSAYFTMQDFTDMTPIGNSPKIIKNLQCKKIPVMALTNRSIPIADRTIVQLKDINIDFVKTSPYKKELLLPLKYNVRFSNGVIFTASNDKGQALIAFLKKTGYKPKKVIFIDDKLKHVKSVERALDQYNSALQKDALDGEIEFIGMRFSLQDKKKKLFDFNYVEQKWYDLKVKLGMEPLPMEPLSKVSQNDVVYGNAMPACGETGE